MTLREHQTLFMKLLPRLIDYIYANGYECTGGELFRTKEQAEIYAKQGKGISKSAHLNKLAIDLNLFRHGAYLDTTDAHRMFGEYWEALHPLCRWGGRFNDGNHYSIEYEGIK